MAAPVSWPRNIRLDVNSAQFSGAANFGVASFQPDYGPPIERPLYSGHIETYGVTLPLMTVDGIKVWKDFVITKLNRATAPFLWRNGMDATLVSARLMGEGDRYSVQAVGQFRRVSFGLMVTGTPWFAEYVPDDLAEVPAVIADWVNGVFAINGERVGASELSAVSGYFEARDGASIDPGYYVAPGSLGVIPPEGVTRLVLFNGPTVTHNGEVVTVNGEPLEVY